LRIYVCDDELIGLDEVVFWDVGMSDAYIWRLIVGCLDCVAGREWKLE